MTLLRRVRGLECSEVCDEWWLVYETVRESPFPKFRRSPALPGRSEGSDGKKKPGGGGRSGTLALATSLRGAI